MTTARGKRIRVRRGSVLVACLAASLLLGLLTRAASAEGDVSVTPPPGSGLRVVWSPLTIEAVTARVSCDVTLVGSFHGSSLRPASGLLMGHIEHAAVNSCSGGTTTVLTETLPWHLRYDSFTGRSPAITGVVVDIVGLSLRVFPTGLAACLTATDSAEPLVIALEREALGFITGARLDETAEIDLDDEGFLCSLAGDASLSGTGEVTAVESERMLYIGLI